MFCPYCRNEDTRVVDSRSAEDGTSIRRRRQCSECGMRFSTTETFQLHVAKRSGAVEPFSQSRNRPLNARRTRGRVFRRPSQASAIHARDHQGRSHSQAQNPSRARAA